MKTPNGRCLVFVSHAFEDKIPIANQLCQILEKRKVNVWYSGNDLRVGDDLTKTILRGIEKSRFGVAIVSPEYISSQWTLQEYYALLAKDGPRHKVLFPVLYNITPEALAAIHLPMANIMAIRADIGLEKVADKLVAEIKIQCRRDLVKALMKWLGLCALCFLIAIAGYFSFDTLHYNGPDEGYIQQSVAKRIATLKEETDLRLKEELHTAKPATQDEVINVYTAFRNLKTYYRNEYILNTGSQTVHAKKNVDALLDANMQELNPLNSYGFLSPDIYLEGETGSGDVRYFFVNTQPLESKIEEVESLSDNTFAVWVNYGNNIRFIGISLTFASQAENTRGMKRHAMEIIALPPRERYVFERTGEGWRYNITAE
ncbi:toll/interleukin-1 receptor domain-containing protein [Ohtaekwangia sp.]|uniref:toll/interleukin-1 receptor domain-containing protein n=1 Tax=Ohtaekwangia sp. TaxID=2066019 RepID=UPI002FDD400D